MTMKMKTIKKFLSALKVDKKSKTRRANNESRIMERAETV